MRIHRRSLRKRIALPRLVPFRAREEELETKALNGEWGMELAYKLTMWLNGDLEQEVVADLGLRDFFSVDSADLHVTRRRWSGV